MTDSDDLMTQDQIDQVEVYLMLALRRQLPHALQNLSWVQGERLMHRLNNLKIQSPVVGSSLRDFIAQVMGDSAVFTRTAALKPIVTALMSARERLCDAREMLKTDTGLFIFPELQDYLATHYMPETHLALERPVVALLVTRDVSERHLIQELPDKHQMTFEDIATCIHSQMMGRLGLFAPPGSRTHFYVQGAPAKHAVDLVITAERDHMNTAEWMLSYRARVDGSTRIAGDHIVCLGQALLERS